MGRFVGCLDWCRGIEVERCGYCGVSHIGLEIASDQQGKIDQFIKTGKGLSDIKIHSQIDYLEYRNLFNVFKDLNPNKRPNPVKSLSRYR